jgi:hypothetical protein
MQHWIDFAKKQKDWAVEGTERGDVPPTVIVERDGKVLAVVIAPQIDKILGLQAAAMCQAGFDPDALTMIMDAHIHEAKSKEWQSKEEAVEEFHKKFPNGMQHACDNENACDLGEISDCLICHRITRDGEITLTTLPYSYHGKNAGVPFKWLDEDERYKDFGNISGDELEGFIPDNLREIMKKTSFFEQMGEELEKKIKSNDYSPERVRYHTARAIIATLNSQNFIVADFISGTHPEWSNFKEIGVGFVLNMTERGVLPKECYEPIKKIIEDHIGTKVFSEKLTILLKANSYWLPASYRNNISDFVSEFEKFCMFPIFPSKFSNKEGSTTKDFEPKRVRVWNGDKSEFLGEGNYVGDVSIYVIDMPDGSLLSNTNAELEPQHVPQGGVVRKSNNNPKIVLDNEQVVYGCQVWWEEI